MILSMLAEAWSAMGANRLRTFLTMLGMVIGVAAVASLFATVGAVVGAAVAALTRTRPVEIDTKSGAPVEPKP